MRENFTIRGSLAILLGMLFTLNIIPKQILHDIVTNHQHSTVKTFGVEERIAKAHYICTIGDETATSPFVAQPALLFEIINSAFAELRESHSDFVYLQEYSSTLLRGPPSC